MLRRSPMKRTPFKSRRIVKAEGPNMDREPRAMARLPVVPNYGGGTTGPAPKTAPQRNRRLLDLAAQKPCLLLVPGCCNHRIDTTVAAHSNWGEHGKAGARKADDHWSCWACSACHRWLDQGGALEAIKRIAFDSGMRRQIEAWKQLAADPSTGDADRRAARWALERHGVTA
jgi:hypothetical protein